MKTRKMRIILLGTLLFTLFSCSEEGEIDLNQNIKGEGNRSLSLVVSPQEIWVGVPVTVKVTMKGKREDDVIFPKVEELPEGLTLKSTHTDDNTLTILFTPQKPGSYQLSPFSVLFESETGSVEILSRPVQIEVISLAGGEESFSPILPAQRIGIFLWWQTVLIILIFLLLGAVLFWVLYWRKRVVLPPPEPIWVTLERGVEEIKEEPLLSGDLGLLYDQTTSLVKKALDGVYNQHTSERTREEFMGELTLSNDLLTEEKMWFIHFFERADMVRFARLSLDREAAMGDLDESLRFVGKAIKKAKEPVLPTYEQKEVKS